jgi:dynein heavy chain, axonemal
LSKLAVHCRGHCFKEPEITKGYNYEAWSEEMKINLMDAGCDLKNTVFLLSDATIKFEFMLEDCNSILNSGEVPNLYGSEDKVVLLERMRNTVKKTGR